MFSSIKQHPTVNALFKQYEMLSAKDRRALNVAAVVIALLTCYFFLWQPAQHFMVSAEAEKVQSEQLLALVKTNRSVLSAMAKNGAKRNTGSNLNSQQLVSSVTNLAKRHAVPLKRFEPSGDNKIKVWIDNASFDKMMSWLQALDSSLNVDVEQISVEKGDLAGQVSARLTLKS